jgi:hypothetical protein
MASGWVPKAAAESAEAPAEKQPAK